MKKILAIMLAAIFLTTGVLPALAEQTGGNKWISGDIAGSMDNAVRPNAVDDFYAYVNYDWSVNAKIPEGEESVSAASELEDQVKEEIKKLLVDETQPSHEAELARNLYAIANDMERRNALGMSPIAERVAEVEAIQTLDELEAYIASGRFPFVLPLFSSANTPDLVDSTKYAVAIAPTPLSLYDAAEYKGEMTQMGKRYDEADRVTFTETYAYMGGDTQRAEEIYKDVIAWETELAASMMDTREKQQSDYISRIYNVYTLDELDALSPTFPLVELLAARQQDGSPTYILFQPEWLSKLNTMYTQDNLEKMKALFIFYWILYGSPYTDDKAIEIANGWDEIALGVSGKSTTEETNYGLVTQMLDMQVGRMYTDACFSEETRKDIINLIDEVIAVYRARIEKADWLTEETRQRALGKLDAMTVQVGYPASWPDSSELKIEKDDTMLDAYTAVYAWQQQLEAKKVGGEVDRLEWSYSPQTVNAFYSASSNSINILAGILGGAYYTPGGAREANLACIGTVIGHEITHAFDENGSQYDEKGNLSSWWTQVDHDAFLTRTGKVSAYMSTMEPLPGVFVDGSIKVDEEVADLGGLSCMLEIASGIENFDYKLFFESYAIMWRQQCTRENFEKHVLSNVHAEGYLRTNIGVQQFEEFYQAYGVQAGDGMYLAPEDRLSVW